MAHSAIHVSMVDSVRHIERLKVLAMLKWVTLLAM